jgi:hypothetical protein
LYAVEPTASGIISHVSTADDPPADLQRLAKAVKNRRLELGLSLRKAAETAELARNTWTSLEDASRRTAETSYAAIERTLNWAPGSMKAVLAGATATPEVQPGPGGEPEQPADSDEAIVRVMRSTKLTDAQKARIVRTLIAEQERARRRILAMVDELIDEASAIQPTGAQSAPSTGRTSTRPGRAAADGS